MRNRIEGSWRLLLATALGLSAVGCAPISGTSPEMPEITPTPNTLVLTPDQLPSPPPTSYPPNVIWQGETPVTPTPIEPKPNLWRLPTTQYRESDDLNGIIVQVCRASGSGDIKLCTDDDDPMPDVPIELDYLVGEYTHFVTVLTDENGLAIFEPQDEVGNPIATGDFTRIAISDSEEPGCYFNDPPKAFVTIDDPGKSLAMLDQYEQLHNGDYYFLINFVLSGLLDCFPPNG